MLELAIWLKQNGFRADQVQAFLPSPMATATAMYHSGKNPLRRVSRSSEEVVIPKGTKVRRLHKAFLRYHDPDNWPILRDALKRMGRADLIGNGKHHLIPAYQPVGSSAGAGGSPVGARRKPVFRTQHTGLPPSGRDRRRCGGGGGLKRSTCEAPGGTSKVRGCPAIAGPQFIKGLLGMTPAASVGACVKYG